MQVELGVEKIWETLRRSSLTNRIPIRPRFAFELQSTDKVTNTLMDAVTFEHSFLMTVRVNRKKSIEIAHLELCRLQDANNRLLLYEEFAKSGHELTKDNFHSFFLSWGSFRWILVVWLKPEPSNVHVWSFSGCRVKPRRLRTFDGPGASKHHQKNHEKAHSERKKERNWWRETENIAKYWAPPFGAPLSEPHRTLWGPLFGAPPFRGLIFSGFEPHPLGHDTHQIQKWIGQKCIGQDWIGQSWPNHQSLTSNFGQKWVQPEPIEWDRQPHSATEPSRLHVCKVGPQNLLVVPNHVSTTWLPLSVAGTTKDATGPLANTQDDFARQSHLRRHYTAWMCREAGQQFVPMSNSETWTSPWGETTRDALRWWLLDGGRHHHAVLSRGVVRPHRQDRVRERQGTCGTEMRGTARRDRAGSSWLPWRPEGDGAQKPEGSLRASLEPAGGPTQPDSLFWSVPPSPLAFVLFLFSFLLTFHHVKNHGGGDAKREPRKNKRKQRKPR